MKRRKDGWVLLVLGFIAVAFCIFVYFIHRFNQRNEFDALLKKDYVLKVDFGIVPKEKLLKEKNSLLRKVNQDNYYYLYICDDNTMFIYYTDWYYVIDPMAGNVLEHKEVLSNEKKEDILNRIEEKMIDSIYSKVKEDYIEILLNDKPGYIQRNELQYILQDNGYYLRAFN